MSYGTVQAEKMTTESGFSLGAGNASSFKNRIINGGMVVSQWNGTSSTTPSVTGAGSGFVVDRFRLAFSQSSKLTGQQLSASPPAGFINYSGISVAATASVGASDYFLYGQPVEGLNITDLAWGTANAKSVTLSALVYSNVTGTFGGSINNSAYNRSYPFTYTISSANTWTQISVTIPGDTTGTWLTTSGVGAYVWFSLGTGTTNSGTAGSWSGSTYYSSTGATSLMGSTSNYLYITGVQLEVGTVATSFDYRPYGTEFSLCQRYFQMVGNGINKEIAFGAYWGTTEFDCFAMFQTSMRTSPTVYQVSGTDYFGIEKSGGNDFFNAWTGIARGTTFGGLLYVAGGGSVSGTAGFAAVVLTNNDLSAFGFSAEL